MITIEVNGRTIPAEKGEMLLDRAAAGGHQGAHALPHRRPDRQRRLPHVRRRGRRPARPGAQLRLSRGRRHEGPHAFAPGRAGAQDDHRTAAGQPSRRLPLLQPQRQLPVAAVGRGIGRAAAAFRRRPHAALHRHLQPLDRPRPGQVHPLRQVRAGVRGNPARGGHRLHRPRLAGQDRHGLRRRPERIELHQLRPVHHRLPHRRADRAEPDQGSARRPERSATRWWSCSMPRPSRSPWARSSACRRAPT